MSKRFVVIAVLLIVVIFAGLFMIFLITTTPITTDEGGFSQGDSTSLMRTNESVSTAISSTATAKVFTVTPTPLTR